MAARGDEAASDASVRDLASVPPREAGRDADGAVQGTKSPVSAARQPQRVEDDDVAVAGGEQDDGLGISSTIKVDEMTASQRLKHLYRHRSLFCLDRRHPVRRFAIRVVEHRLFNLFTILVILVNSAFLAMADPLQADDSPRNKWLNDAEVYFLSLFIVEMVLRITAMGFVLHEYAYLRNPWNWLDFVIVCIGIFELLPTGLEGGNVSSLRTFRVLRPLKTIKSIDGLRVLVNSLLLALRMMVNVFALWAFFFLIFGLVGMRLWSGVMRQRCFIEGTDVLAEVEAEEILCSFTGSGGSRTCPPGQECRVSDLNINFGITSFDNIGAAFLAIFVIITLEGWTKVQTALQTAFSFHVWPYFVVLIIFGAFFILRLALGVIYAKYHQSSQDQRHVSEADAALRAATKAMLHRRKKRMAVSDDTGADKDGAATDDAASADVARVHQPPLASTESAPAALPPLVSRTPASPAVTTTTSAKSMEVEMDNVLEMKQESPVRRTTSTLERVDDAELAAIVPDGGDAADGTREKDGAGTTAEVSPSSDAAGEGVDETGEIVFDPSTLSNPVRRVCGKIIMSRSFLGFIFVAIILNTIFLAMEHHNMPTGLASFLSVANYVLTAVFIVEFLLKITGMGPRLYAKDAFNIFDGVIVFFSIVELIVGDGGGTTALRAFRLLRILKLVRSWVSLRKILEVILLSLPNLANCIFILLIFIFIYSVLGMQLFGGIFIDNPKFDAVPRANFDTFLWSVITVFQILTSEAWDQILYATMHATAWPAAFYFVSLVVIGNYIFLNLFLAVLLENFRLRTEQLAVEKTAERRKALNLDPSEPLPDSPEALKLAEARKAKDNADRVDIMALSPLVRKIFLSRRLYMPVHKDDEVPLPAELAEIRGDVQEEETFERVPTLHGNALAMPFLGPDSRARLAVASVVFHPVFELIIILCILVSSALLAVEYPAMDPDGTLAQTLFVFDIAFTTIFCIEAALKILALGFAGHENAYLRNPWNILDFTVVGVSILTLALSGINVKFLRSLRALRPLRLVGRSPAMKLVVDSLARSIPSIINVFMISLLFWLVFGILAVQLFGGRLYECNDSTVLSRGACTGFFVDDELHVREREWTRFPSHYDNVFNAMLTLFEIGTLDEWQQRMYDAVDITGVDNQPQRDNQPGAALFFVAFVVIGAYFMLNLFVVVVVDNFNLQQQEANGSAILTPKQQEWVAAQRSMLRNPPRREAAPPQDGIRLFLFGIVTSRAFEFAIMAAILLNVFFMMTSHYGQPESWSDFLVAANFVFMGIFILEAVMKLAAFLPRDYFRSHWNKFDFFIVIASIVGAFIDLGPGAMVFRIIRVLRIFKLVRSARGLRLLLFTLIYSLPSLYNVGSLIFLIYFIYAVAGVSVFGEAEFVPGGVLSDQLNFRHFGHAMLTLFVVMTGENWTGLMHELEDDAPAVFLYFLTFQIIIFFVMMNLMVALVLSNFNELTSIEGQLLGAEDFDRFREVWGRFDPNCTHFIRTVDFHVLLLLLPPPLGLGRDATRQDALTLVKCLAIPSYEGMLHYKDCLLALSHRQYRVSMQRAEMPSFLRRMWPSKFKSLKTMGETPWTSTEHVSALHIQSLWRGKVARRRMLAERASAPT